MIRLRCLIAVVGLLFATAGWAATTRAPSTPATGSPAAPPGMQQFEKNTALGADLQTRLGTDAEYSEVQTLAERGVAATRNLVQANPQNAEAQYMLGSWLIYGYRVVTTQETTTDAAGETHTTRARKIVGGLSDDPTEGLEALKRAADLAPGNAQYVLDYAAALLDTNRPEQTIAVLEGAWNGKPVLNQQQKARAGVLLSDAYAAQGRISDAREWLYSTLLLNPDNADIVTRLRALDAQMSVPAQTPPPAITPAAPTEAPSEAAPAPSTPPSEEVAPEPSGNQEAAPEQPSEGSGESAPPDQGGQAETAPQQDTGPSNQGGSATDDQTLTEILGEDSN